MFEDVLPHRPRRRRTGFPDAAATGAKSKRPFLAEPLGPHPAAFAGGRVGVNPLDFHGA